MRLDDMRGHGTPEQYRALTHYAATVPAGQMIVEVGTFRGKSACYLARETENTVVTIDPHDLPGVRRPTGVRHSRRRYNDPRIRREAKRNTEQFPNIIMVRGFSEDVGREWPYGPCVGLLYLDGDHREGAVRRDFSAWEPNLAPEALVIWDDHTDNFPGVQQIVERHEEQGRIVKVEQIDGMLVTRRTR